jgi:hypothetical protein
MIKYEACHTAKRHFFTFELPKKGTTENWSSIHGHLNPLMYVKINW